MQPVIVLHHHEIILKGDNRPYFERQLMKNVRTALQGVIPQKSIHGGYGRFVIDLPSGSSAAGAEERLSFVFGIANICAGVKVEQNVDAFCAAADRLLEGEGFGSIRIHARRADKQFPVGSMAVNRQVGEHVCNRFGVHADLSDPDVTIFIEIVDKVAYVYRSKLSGCGGLPVGVSGRVVALLSAGFDSPVAAWQMMKRGATVTLVHFHSMPYTGERSLEQVRRLAEVLTKYQFRSRLYLVPFAEVQNEIVARAPQSLRVILYRRMMVRIAEAIAESRQAEALVTGESVGQVASQTLRNIRIINDAATLPILRPLSGLDKEEIMSVARRIGTYEISEEPYDDCCSYLAPRKPETWAHRSGISEAESLFDIPALVRSAVSRAAPETLVFPEAAREALAALPGDGTLIG